jgi:hypothetical protein
MRLPTRWALAFLPPRVSRDSVCEPPNARECRRARAFRSERSRAAEPRCAPGDNEGRSASAVWLLHACGGHLGHAAAPLGDGPGERGIGEAARA